MREAAVAVLRGERHPLIGNAQFFHAASYRARYDNMHYVAKAGGNAFYEKSDREGYLPAPVPHAVVRTAEGSLVPFTAATQAVALTLPADATTRFTSASFR